MPDYPSILSADDARQRLRELPRGATVLLLGGVDTGKTTFARESVAALTASGRSAAVVDCDLGQSEIGPPGTVGIALAEAGLGEALRSLRDLPLLATYFVGATSPVRHLLDVCVGACQMARAAKKRRPDLIIVDTCGLVQGRAARALKQRMAELLLPQAILAFARGDELEPLLSVFGHLKTPDLWRIAVSGDIGRKTPAARATRRAARFSAAFEGAQEMTLSWDAVALLGTALGLGTTLPTHLQQFISQSLRLPVLHAEQSAGGGLFVIVNGERWDASGLAAIEGYFKTRAVTITPAQKFAHLLVGLVGPTGGLRNLGLIERIDFPRRAITLLTPCRRPAAVAQLWLGSIRLRPGGRELGEVKPGEI